LLSILLAGLADAIPLSKDYEILPKTTQAFIYVAMIRLILKQLV